VNIFEAILRSHTDEDLLCVPGICLGFHPTESCVVLGISENRVEFCARADLDWLDEDGSDLIRQVEAAAQPVRSCSFVILGYTEDPEGNCGRLIRLALELRGRVTDVLVATDIVARGIDIDDIAMVINYDVPHDAEDYVHRIGRTARAAREGSAITFVSEDDIYYFQQIEKFLEKEVQKTPLHR